VRARPTPPRGAVAPEPRRARVASRATIVGTRAIARASHLGTLPIARLAPSSTTHDPPRLPRSRSRGTLRDDTKQYREDKRVIDLALKQRPLSRYEAYWACADIKRAGAGVLVRKSCRQPLSVTRSLVAPNEQHEDGRVLLLEFETFALLNTYAQNNGWTPESMAKRRRWDAEVKAFLLGRSRVPRPAFAPKPTPRGVGDPATVDPPIKQKPIVWTGDLNACHTTRDVTHPAFFANQKPEASKKNAPPPPQPPDPGDRGQPGFTPNERRRFDDVVKSAHLVDAYRRVRGEEASDRELATSVGDAAGEGPRDDEKNASSPPEAKATSAMTWFGHPGVTQVGKYRGKGMRLDYFWVDEALAARLEACEQATDDVPEKEMAERPDRAFFGSDHCAVYMRLARPDEEKADDE
jgi:exonuclease III